jgi:ribosomal protein S18 acetylase RimI-like enzyme
VQHVRLIERIAVVDLVPMSATAFSDYVEVAVSGYAEENVAAGRWPQDGALARSRADLEESLPQGLGTPDPHLLEIRDADTGVTVGFLCFAVREKHGLRTAFVFDIEVKQEFRRRGYASAALTRLEPIARDLGLSGIGLHVFAQNAAARALYGKLGYAVTGVNMLKPLGDDSIPTTPAGCRSRRRRR